MFVQNYTELSSMVVKNGFAYINGKAFGLDEIVDYNSFVLLGYSPAYAAKKNTQFRKDTGEKKIYTYRDLAKWLNNEL